MSNKILIKRGSGAPTTSDLDNYEIAYDTGANKLYIRDGSDIIPFGAIVDEDNFASDDANRSPSQQSVKAYIASELAAAGAGDITAVNITAGTGLSGSVNTTSGAHTQTLSVSGLTVSELAAGSLTTSAESFADNDTTLMTSAAINDRIESFGYITTDTNTVTTNIAGTGVSVSSGTGNSTISIGQSVGTSDTVAFGRINLGSTDTSSYLTGDPKLSANGYIMVQGIVNESETGTAPAAITFGDGATLGSDQISLVTAGNRRLYVASNGNVTIAENLTVNGTIGGSAIKDQDDMSSNSATHLATQQSIKAYVDAEVAGIVNSAPAALNTLDELAAALGDDANFSTTTSTALGNRLRVDTASQGLTGTQQANAITNLGITATKAELNYVDGVTSAIQTQLNAKLTSSSSLNGSNITSGTVAAARIANLAASKITSGTISTARLGIPSSGDWFSGGAAIVATDGVMEIGRYIDFHNTDTSTDDYHIRLDCESTSVLNVTGGTLEVGGSRVLTVGDEGSGNGLDADTLDGSHASAFLTTSGTAANSQLLDSIDSTGFTRKGVQSGTPNTASNRTTFTCNDAIETSNGNQSGLEVWQDTAGADAFMTFHVANDYAGYFGLDGSTNDLSWGGWSNGNGNKYKIWHAGNTSSFTGDLVSSERDKGVFGTYDSTKTDHIWSMGTAYRNSSTGADFGNLYGLAYKHVNNTTGGNMAGGHQMVWVTNGTPRAALGEVSIWSKNYFQAAGNYGGSWDTNNNTALTFTASSSGTAYNVLRCDTDNGFKLQTLGGTGGTQRWYTSGSNYIQFSGTTITASLNGTASNAALLDNIDSSQFLRSDANDTFTGTLSGSRIDLGYAHGNSNSIGCSNWFRSSGTTGWYNGTYGGGIRMIDTTWVRVYNSKAFYVANQIAATGDVTAYYSDERLKTKIETIDNAVDKVMSLEGFIYEENELAEELGYTNKGKRQAGVSAQQVEKVLPEAVTLAAVDMETDEFSGEITSKSGENYLTVKYEKMVPLLIEAIKEQQQQINKLKEQLNG